MSRYVYIVNHCTPYDSGEVYGCVDDLRRALSIAKRNGAELKSYTYIGTSPTGPCIAALSFGDEADDFGGDIYIDQYDLDRACI